MMEQILQPNGKNDKIAEPDVGLNTKCFMGKKRGLSGNIKIEYYI
jgi:hypothetical protein